MSRREGFHVYLSTTHHRHRNHSTAVSDAKYSMFVDMADITIHGTSELEVGKKGNLPFNQGCPRLPKRCLEWIPIWKFNAFGARRHTMQNWSDKHTSDSIFKLKSSPKMVQNRAPRGPFGVQNPFWRPPGTPSWKEDVFEGLEDASRTSFGRLFGRPKSFQSRYGSASNTQLMSKSVLTWFRDVLDTNFWVFFKAFAS